MFALNNSVRLSITVLTFPNTITENLNNIADSYVLSVLYLFEILLAQLLSTQLVVVREAAAAVRIDGDACGPAICGVGVVVVVADAEVESATSTAAVAAI